MEKMLRRVRDETAVVIQHPQETLELFHRRGGLNLPDRSDFFGKRCDAIFIHMIAQKVERGNAEDALFPVDDEVVFVQDPEDVLQVLSVLLM